MVRTTQMVPAVRQGIVHEGWLLKKRRKKLQGFARRYFTLFQSGILAYSFQPGLPVRDQIALPKAAISTAHGRKDIHIDSNTATFHIKCLSTGDFDSWMVALRKFTVSEGFKSGSIRHTPRLGNLSLVRSGAILEEMALTISELETAISVMQHASALKKQRSLPKLKVDKHKDYGKDVKDGMFGIFKRSASSHHHEPGAELSHPDARAPPGQPHSPSQQHIQFTMDALKTQHTALTNLINTLAHLDANFTSARASPLPSTAEEDDNSPTPSRFSAPLGRLPKRTPTMDTASESLNEWFDAQEGFDGAQEFLLDFQPPSEEPGGQILGSDSHSSLGRFVDSSVDTDSDEEARVPDKDARSATINRDAPVVRRSRLPTGPVGDEGSLFAILKKNVGKDLSTIAFPVTFNEPLTLLQRVAEEVEYYDLLRQAAETIDPVERLRYVAAFAVSSYAHTQFRTGRKGFNPMLAETFEDVRMKFIAEKVSHQPLVMAYHADGEGWELYATSAGRTKFWGKSLEIIPIGTIHVKIGDDHFEWKKPSSFMRNLMMGTKYLEHCGKLTIDNTSTDACCVLDFKQSGYWADSNVVSGTIFSPSGKIVTYLEGKWNDQIAQTMDSSNFRILWRMTPFPKDAPEFYGFTSFGITLNEIASDLVGKLPPTDSRYRPDVRALEEGNLDLAEQEKTRVEEMQRERRRRGAEPEPRWFKQVGEEWIYKGGYWEARARGWTDVKVGHLW